MSTSADHADLVRTFLNAIEPYANQIPDLFGDDPTLIVPRGVPAPPLRVRGLLAQLVEKNREVERVYVWQQGVVTQQNISRTTGNTAVLTSRLRDLYRKAETDRASAQAAWFAGLSSVDRRAIEAYCLTASDSILRPHFPSLLPASFHGPLSRLALEYAAIVRRAASEREKYRTSHERQNHTVVRSVMAGYRHEEEEATARVIGRWYLELPPVQLTDGPAPAGRQHPKRVGRPRVGEGKKNRDAELAKKNIYDFIQSKKKPGQGPQTLLSLLKGDKDLAELLRKADLKLSKPLIRAALRKGSV